MLPGTRRGSHSAALLAAILALATVTGCAADTPPFQTGNLIGPSEVPAAWQEALDNAPGELPDGPVWPVDPPAYLLEEDSQTEEDLPAMMLSGYWLCAWEVEYVDALSTENSADAERALDAVKRYAELPVVKKNFIDLQLWYTTVAQKAIDGDPTGIENDVLNCRPNLEMR
jgi:hypothetical protein